MTNYQKMVTIISVVLVFYFMILMIACHVLAPTIYTVANISIKLSVCYILFFLEIYLGIFSSIYVIWQVLKYSRKKPRNRKIVYDPIA